MAGQKFSRLPLTLLLLPFPLPSTLFMLLSCSCCLAESINLGLIFARSLFVLPLSVLPFPLSLPSSCLAFFAKMLPGGGDSERERMSARMLSNIGRVAAAKLSGAAWHF